MQGFYISIFHGQNLVALRGGPRGGTKACDVTPSATLAATTPRCGCDVCIYIYIYMYISMHTDIYVHIYAYVHLNI